MASVNAFTQSVENALGQINQPATLGHDSPLAAPYFLGRFMGADLEASTPEGRGKVLINLLKKAANAVSDDHQKVLQVAFFEADLDTPLNEFRANAVNRSLRQYYRDRTAAIKALADEFGRLVIPPLRPEMPRAKRMIGRDSQLAEGIEALRAGQSVTITGVSGSGKTTLAGHIIANWSDDNSFWLTIRPGFTDNTNAFLFSLCYWLRNNGASNAWHQLVADTGKEKTPIQWNRIRPMLRYDIQHIQHSRPNQEHLLLICVDDIDLLEPKKIEHDRVLDILRELRDLVSLLLIGQNMVIDTYTHVRLVGLENAEVSEMLRETQFISLSKGEIQRLAVATRGLPALLQLFILLHRMGEPVETTLKLVEQDISTDALFQRVWIRLSEAERRLLMEVSVYDGYAPSDEWGRDSGLITSLAQGGLLVINKHSGVAVSSYARLAVLRRISANLRPLLHLQAAEMLERRGEFTSAALQYQQAQQPFKAIELWSEHRFTETERGHAEAALAMLHSISPDLLRDEDDRRLLFALRAELHRKMGAIAQGLEDLSSTTWPSTHPITPYAQMLRGDLHELSGSIESAKAAYESALYALVGSCEAREVDVYNRIGFINLYRSRDLAQAAQAALRARFRSESFHGKVLEEKADFVGAYERFQAAATLLNQLENATPAHAINESDLGRIAMAMGRYDEAISRIQKSIELYEKVGDHANRANAHMNLSFTFNACGKYDQALETAVSQLQFAKDRNDGYLISALACNAAESCALLNKWDEADHYITLAFQQEEEYHFHYIVTVQGIVQSKQGDFKRAEQLFNDAIQIAQKNDDPFGEAPIWRWLGRIHAQQSKHIKAKQAFERANSLYQTMGMLHELKLTQQLIVDLGA